MTNSTTNPSNDLPSQKSERLDGFVEILVTFMLGVTALATAWSGFQASLWGGVQAIDFNQASGKRVESVRYSNEANATMNLDIWLFGQWIEYQATDKINLADFYQKRFRDEFKTAFQAWMATDPFNNSEAPATPFKLPEYRLKSRDLAVQLETEAGKLFDEGVAANRNSDKYVLNTVFLASVLFLSSLHSRIKWLKGRVFISVLALAMLLLGIYNLIIYPLAPLPI